jgi:hypothetical protein
MAGQVSSRRIWAAVVELVGHAGELEDLAGAKERLVVAKGGSLPHR